MGSAEKNTRSSFRTLTQADLRSAFDSIERDLAAGRCVPADQVLPLRRHALNLAAKTGNPRIARRLAKLLAIAGQDECDVITFLRKASTINPSDPQTAFMLSDALVAQDKPVEALQVLLPILTAPTSHAEATQRSAKLQMRLGSTDAGLRLLRVLADNDPSRVGGLLSALIAMRKEDEALTKARSFFESDSANPKVWQSIYTTLTRLGATAAEIAAARHRLLCCAEAADCASLWRARLLWADGEAEAAIAEIESALSAAPDDSALLKERANYALSEGYWGRDAAILLRARPLTAAFSALSCGIIQADRLLRAYGGSLQCAAEEPEKFAHIKTPECVFDRVIETCWPPVSDEPRSGIVMIIGSLAGGGAERILANTFRELSQSHTFEWMKLYVGDLENEPGKDFYLPQTGLGRSDVIVLKQPCEIAPPLSWLPRWQAQESSRILERLRADRPAILHAWLEPLNVFAGLAAVLAGVPRIILHTHNMRPTELSLRSASRLRGCYQALLRRPEVSLVGCARACIEDYVDWLGLHDRSKLHVVRNAIDTQEIIAANHADARQELRASYGIDPSSFVIGTAFRFTEVKQPFLWVDAAAEVAQVHSNCRFVMFGDGELRRATEEYVRTKDLGDKFIFPGRVVDFYHRLPLLDLFVLSSRSEALPNVLLEAQAAGIPVVAFAVGGVAEAMREDVTGILVKGRTASDLAAGILSAIAVPQWCRNVRNAGPEFVTKEFSVEGMLHLLRDILRPTDRYQPARPAMAAVAA